MFEKTPNLCFLITILFLTAAIDSNQISLSTSTTDKNTANNSNEKPDYSLIQLLKSNKNNSSETKVFDVLLEDIFTPEDNKDNSWLNNEYSQLMKDLNSKEEENYFSGLNKEPSEHNSFVFINEKETEEKLLKAFCDQEKLDLEEKMKNGESHIFDLETEKKHLSYEIDSLVNKTKTNEENLQIKSEEIRNQANELNELKNPLNNKHNSISESLIVLESLISLVKNYYEDIENSSSLDIASDGAKDRGNFAANFINLTSQAEKLKDYSLSTFLTELANKHFKAREKGMRNENNISLLEYKSEIKNKILQALENIKKKYEEKHKEYKENLESEIALKEKGLENNRKLVELISEETMKYNNDLLINKQRLENTLEALGAYKDNIEKLSEIISDLNKICI